MKERSKILVLAEYIEGLNMMEGAAGQLVHHFQNIKWMAIRDLTRMIRDHHLQSIVKEGLRDA